MNILNPGASVTLNLSNLDSVSVSTRDVVVVEAVSGMGIAAGVIATVDGTRTFGPYPAGSLKLTALGGDCSYGVIAGNGSANYIINGAGKVTGLTGPDGGTLLRSAFTQSRASVANLYPVNSERVNTGNSNTTPVVSHGNAIPPNPLRALTGSIVGTSGNSQQNMTVPADTAWYVFSFLAYVAPGVTGAQVSALCALPGGDSRAFTYDWDNPLTASSNVYASSGTGASSTVQVDDLGGGFRRFHNMIKNNLQVTYYIQHAGTVATNKAIYSAFQLVRIPDDGRSLRVDEYIPVGQLAKPWTGRGRDGYASRYRARYPFAKIAIYSDSIWAAGAGTPASGAWRLTDSVLEYFGLCELNSYGGNTTAQVCGYFDAQNVGGYFRNYLVIFNCGRNDGTIGTQSGRDAVLARLKASIGALGHTNFKVCGVLARFTATSASGQEENTSVNSAGYAGIIAYNAMLAAEFADKFIDVQGLSVNAYNPLDTSDAAAFALGMRPPSLAPLTGDGLHPGPLESMVLGAAVVESIKYEYGVL